MSREYAVIITWPTDGCVEGAGPLPALLLDRGQLPPTVYAKECTLYVRSIDLQALPVEGRVLVHRRRRSIMTWFDTTPTQPGPRCGATWGKAEQSNPLRYAGFATLGKPLQRPMHRSQ